MALERVEHRQVGPVEGLGDDPAEVAHRLVVVEGQGERDSTRQAGSLGGPRHLDRVAGYSTALTAARPVARLRIAPTKPVLPGPADHTRRQFARKGCVDQQAARRVRHRRCRRGRRRLEDRGLVRVQQPRPPRAGDQRPDPRGRRRARLPARSGGPDADPAPDRDDRACHATGARLDVLEPVLRDVQRRRRGRGRGARATASTSSRRSTARSRRRLPGRRSTGSS